MGNVKDPKINSIILTGRIRDEPEVKRFENGGVVVTVAIECQQLKKGKEGAWEHQKWTIKGEAWNKAAEKLEKIAAGTLAAFTGKLAADIYEYQGTPRQKLFLNVFQVETIETKDPSPASRPRTKEPPPEDEPPEDNLPF